MTLVERKDDEAERTRMKAWLRWRRQLLTPDGAAVLQALRALRLQDEDTQS